MGQGVPDISTVRGDREGGARHAEADGHRPQTRAADPYRVQSGRKPVLVMRKTCGHDRVHPGDGRHEQEGQEVVFEGHEMQSQHHPIVRQGVNAHPKVRRRDAEAREVPCSPQQSHAVQHKGSNGDHDRHAKLTVQAPGRAADEKEDQGRLGSDGIVIMTLGQPDVEPDQAQQRDAKAEARVRQGVKPPPMVRIQCESVEDLHRNDDPCHAQQAHRRPWNPPLAKPQSCSTEHEQARSGHARRKGRAHVCSQRRIRHHHRDKQALSEATLAFNGQAGHHVVGRFVRLRSGSKRRLDVAHSSVGLGRGFLGAPLVGRLRLHVQGEAGQVQATCALEGALPEEVVLLRFFHATVLAC